jgi:HSP20 family protein
LPHPTTHGFNRFLEGFTDRAGKGETPLMVADCWRNQAAVPELPEVDVSKDGDEYLLKADLPEMKKEDVKLTVEDDILCLFGERKNEKEDQSRKFGRMERWYGNFRRIFKLPGDVIGSKVTAELRDGVLGVHIPVTAITQPKPVEVKVQ